MRLPSSFVELWTQQGVVAFLHAHTNSDWPVSVDELDCIPGKWIGYDPIADDCLPFMHENQGVVTWAIKLKDGNDPSVMIEVDSGCPPLWIHHADSFTEWLQSVMFDGSIRKRCRWQAQAARLSETDRTKLSTRFIRSITTYAWPGETNLRFSSPDGTLLIHDTHARSDWYLAPTEGRSEQFHERIIDLCDLKRSLYRLNGQSTGDVE
jgi:hypothetical protein